MSNATAPRMRNAIAWIGAGIAVIVATVWVSAYLGKPAPVVLNPPPGADSTGSHQDLDIRRVTADIAAFAATPSRATGSLGARKATNHILAALAGLGAKVETYGVPIPVPVTESCVLSGELGGDTVEIALYPLWPNLARTGQTPPEGLTGPLVDAGRGTEAELEGRTIRDALVVMDWDTDLEWLSVPEFGAKGVIFRANDSATGYVARNKFVSMPADIPRYYVRQEDSAALSRLLASAQPKATIRCRSSWQLAEGTNILARINEGSEVAADDPGALVFHAYYDSISVVPDLAPGAEQACGAAVLLELGRYLAKTPSQRPVYLLFTSGHGQALTGMMHFVTTLREQVDGEPADTSAKQPLLAELGRPALFVGLDLSSGSDQYGVFSIGHFRIQAEHKLRPIFSVLGSELDRYAQTVRGTPGEEGPRPGLVDCINLTRGRGWWTYFPYPAPFESEIPVMAGFPGITLATINDDRRYVDTPGDRLGRLRLDLLEQQISAKPGERAGLAAVAGALVQWSGPFVSRPLADVWGTLAGRVVWLDQERNYVPNEPLRNAMVFLKTMRGDKRLMGTRGIPAAMTDDQGRFTFEGLLQFTENAQFRTCQIEAYGTATESFCQANPEALAQFGQVLRRAGNTQTKPVMDGSVLYAVDMAREKDYPYRIGIEKAIQHLNLVSFPCRSVTITGLTDPRGYIPLKDLQILEAATFASPFQFGKSTVDSAWGDDAENMVTLWANPATRVMLTFGHGFQEKRLILINNTPEDPHGRGFVLEDLQTVPSMVLQGARDMWNLDATRIAKLERNGVSNPRLREFHATAGAALDKAAAALGKADYHGYRIASEKAWALEGKAYIEILSMIDNMVRGVLFYLALLLPFSYCLERLLVASGTIKRRIIWISVIFSLCFVMLAAVHPAFRFTMTPLLVLLAFIIIALVATVSVLIVTRMDGVLQERKRVTTGRHDESTNVGGIAVRAVDLGISNIRRRPQRAFLTGLTVVLVTFILLSFTSLVPVVSISRLTHPDGVATYRGLLTRDRAWRPLPIPLHASVARTFSEHAAGAGAEDSVVAARAWFFSDRSGKLSQIDVTTMDEGATKAFTAIGLLCLQPTEPVVTGVDRALLTGRWFDSDDEKGVILPLHVAEQLGIGKDGIGRQVRIFGEELPVLGILDSEIFDGIRDIDGEPLTPVNFVLQQQMQAERAAAAEEADTLEEYVHYGSDQMVILPLRLGLRLGATVRSIAVRPPADLDLDQEAEGYTKRSNLTILACDGQDVVLYAALNTSQVSAAWQIVIPLFLGSIMILGTMLGSVYERRREIFVYNSVGLSPGNVSSLFLAESAVYAIIGAGLGYLLGQAVARLFQMTGWLPGLTLNYTAGSAVLVTVLTMAIVLLSTVYPARQAFHAATPDAEKEGSDMDDQAVEHDRISLFLPFVATPANVGAMQAYMAEYLASIEGVTVGQLAIDDLSPRLDHQDGHDVPTLAFRAWLAPFDLGTSHDTELRIVFREDRGVHQIHLTARRYSGDRQNWRRLLPRFVLAIRRQFLMWRVLSTAEIESYRERARTMFGTP
ncbi:MAG: M28 family peptidase [Victivallales bacterium]|nr:M28 family peptidase [Victivallales bacterium]